MNKKETRFINNEIGKEMRAYEEDGKRFLSGYASVFNSKSRLIFELREGKVITYYEYINTGAFDGVLEDNVIMNINHNDNNMLGRKSSGTLQLETDEIGLRFKVELPNTTLGNDTWELVKRGDYSECSFAFYVEKDKWERIDNEPIRFIDKVKRLVDVSIVTNGAYQETSVTTDVEYVERMINELDEIENENKDKVEVSLIEERINYLIDIYKLKNTITKLKGH